MIILDYINLYIASVKIDYVASLRGPINRASHSWGRDLGPAHVLVDGRDAVADRRQEFGPRRGHLRRHDLWKRFSEDFQYHAAEDLCNTQQVFKHSI